MENSSFTMRSTASREFAQFYKYWKNAIELRHCSMYYACPRHAHQSIKTAYLLKPHIQPVDPLGDFHITGILIDKN